MKRILLAAAGLLVAFALLGVALSGSSSLPKPIAALRHALAIDHAFRAPHPLPAAIRAPSRVPALTEAPTVSIQSQGLRPRTEAAPTVGETFTTSNGTWNNTPTSYTYAWEDCNSTGSLCVPALGSPTNTSAYVIVPADTSAYIQVTVTATNAYGSGATSSILTGVVASTGGYTGSCTTTVGPTSDLTADINALTAGQTLCLTSGTYTGTNAYGDSTPGTDIVGDQTSSGSSGSPITITAAPGAAVTLVGGEYWQGNYITIEHLNINDANQDYPTAVAGCTAPESSPIELWGSHITFQNDNVWNSNASNRGIGFLVEASGETFEHNKISDFGCSTGQYDHFIYDEAGTGTVIAYNWMWDDASGYGIQLYPNPVSSLIYGNVFDGVTDGTVDAIAAGYGGNQTYNNVVANAIQGASGNYSGYLTDCQPDLGTVDTVNSNAIWNDFGGYGVPCTGVTATGNQTLSANPFVNEAAHNYSSTASALSSYSLWNGVGPPVPDPAPADPGFVDP